MAVLMQTCGRSFAALLENVVAQQQRLAVTGQTCAAQDRLNLYGVDPMVLTKAANRLATANLARTTTQLLELLHATDSDASHTAGGDGQDTSPLPLRERARERGPITSERSEQLNSTLKTTLGY